MTYDKTNAIISKVFISDNHHVIKTVLQFSPERRLLPGNVRMT